MLTSFVPGHEGDCKPVWLNRNQLCHRLDAGVTGFFRRVVRLAWLPYFSIKAGPEFHGIVRGGTVHTTGDALTFELTGLRRNRSNDE